MSLRKWLLWSVLLITLSVGGVLARRLYGTLALPAPPAPDTSTAAPAYATAIARARQALLPLLTEYPALSVTVAKDGAIVWSEALGWADVATQRPATVATRFRIYSNSKPLTAVLALRLAAQGRLDLDAPIGAVLDDLPAASQAITLRQLLGHLGGIRDYRAGEWMTVSQGRCVQASEALAPFVADPLLSTPGTRFQYASFGYVLASAAIEVATGQHFQDLLQQEVLGPAGMADSGPETDGDPVLAGAYESALFGRVAPAPAVDNSCKFGAGALVATSADLVRFGMALLDGRLLEADAGTAMLTASGASKASGQPYGLGLGVADSETLGPIAAHSGGAVGGRSYLLLSPERGLVVALLGNLEGRSLGAAASAVAAAFNVVPTAH